MLMLLYLSKLLHHQSNCWSVPRTRKENRWPFHAGFCSSRKHRASPGPQMKGCPNASSTGRVGELGSLEGPRFIFNVRVQVPALKALAPQFVGETSAFLSCSSKLLSRPSFLYTCQGLHSTQLQILVERWGLKVTKTRQPEARLASECDRAEALALAPAELW